MSILVIEIALYMGAKLREWLIPQEAFAVVMHFLCQDKWNLTGSINHEVKHYDDF